MRNKEELEDRWRSVYLDYQESEEFRKISYKGPWTNRGLDNQGFNTSSWSDHLNRIGIFSYLLDADVNVFKKSLKESVQVCQEIFELFDKGEPIDYSFLTIKVYNALFEALATGDIQLAKNFAQHLGGRPEIEKKYNKDFDVYLGYTLKYFVEENKEGIQKYLPLLSEYCKAGRFTTFKGYVTVFEAILEKDVAKANQGFKEITIGHNKELKGRGERYFEGSPEEDICLWGLGLANLAFYYGLPVEIDDPLIPKALLCPELLLSARQQ